MKASENEESGEEWQRKGERLGSKRVENRMFVSRADAEETRLRKNTAPATVFLSGFTRRRLDVAMF